MVEEIFCPQCEVVEMEFQERLKNGKTKEGFYRRRRFKCPVCGTTDTFAGHVTSLLNSEQISAELLEALKDLTNAVYKNASIKSLLSEEEIRAWNRGKKAIAKATK